MFTEGLDKNALRWVREVSFLSLFSVLCFYFVKFVFCNEMFCFSDLGFFFFSVNDNQKEVPFSRSGFRPRIDPISGIKSGNSRGFGLPPPAKFRSGHLPSNAMPLSSSLRGEIDDSGSNSGDDGSTGSEDEGGYLGRYSLDSSPSEIRVSNGTSTTAQRYGNGSLTQRRPRYASDYTYSEVSSSRETLVGRPRDSVVKKNGNVRQSGFTDDDEELSDSASCSEFSTTQVGDSVNGPLLSRMNVQCAAQKV